MARLLRDGEVLAEVEVADTWLRRLRGLLGRRHLTGALLISPANCVHSLGMRFTIDVAFCDRDFRILNLVRLRPWRATRMYRKAHQVLEAEQGAFARWKLAVGDVLEVRS